MTSKSGQVQKVKKVIQVQSYDSEVTGGHHHIRIKEIHKATTSATVGVTSGRTGAGVVTWHGGAGCVAVAWRSRVRALCSVEAVGRRGGVTCSAIGATAWHCDRVMGSHGLECSGETEAVAWDRTLSVRLHDGAFRGAVVSGVGGDRAFWSGMGWHSGGDVTMQQGLDRNVTWWVCPGLWGWAGVVVKGTTMSK
ncbi:hypothetical protein EDB89DRAFT_1901115 [Lactarius sanguifluus]|nr:hypothetical protein EDB89DRAFT_1901115 [Lactarius sanguifluus]